MTLTLLYGETSGDNILLVFLNILTLLRDFGTVISESGLWING